MGWTYVVRSTELQSFRRCRRAWDLGASVRQRFVPRQIPSAVSFERAVRAALATYYFPAMDDWSRAIVRPLGMKAFDQWMAAARAEREQVAPLTPDETSLFGTDLTVGRALLTNFFAWAAAVDDFDSIFADHEVWAPIPDPADPDRDIGTPDGRPIRLLGRIDQLIGDAADEFWLVDHRIVRNSWTAESVLMADELAMAHCWALQVAYPQLVLAGTITNELRIAGQIEASPPGEIVERDVRDMSGSRHVSVLRSPLSPEDRVLSEILPEAVGVDQIADQHDNGLFRRTVIRRNQASLQRVGVAVAADVKAMQDPAVAVAPTFTDVHCPVCPYRGPCDAMESGGDVATVLGDEFVTRVDEDDEGLRRSPFRHGSRSDFDDGESRTVNFRWG